jgi:hypothetical protein
MEVGVAVGAVDPGGKFRMQRDGAADRIEGEIRSVGFALDFELIEVAGVFSGGGKRTADAGERIEVGIGEIVIARNGRGGGIFGVPGAEGAFGGDFAFWLGVG